MKQVLVTGANGQLGKSIKRISPNFKGLKFVFTDVADLDITNSEEVNTFFESNALDYCINCAAYTEVDKAEEEAEKVYSINATAVKNLAEACQKTGAVLIHISTDFVFDGTKRTPYTEEDMPNPLSVYGKSKLKGEEHVQESCDRHFIVRTSWLYSEYGNNFVKKMLRLAETRKQISVVNDQIGSPTYAGDLAEFILKVISSESTAYGLYHYSNLGAISWYDFAVEIFRQHQKNVHVVPIPTRAYPTLANRPAFSVMDLSRVKIIFGSTIPLWKHRAI
jgi:dTDP-4-dehydrorhamnose reductase|tara:strand:+ start:484 stop:1317 length:834 start_codon:yes stop_codon:yes gene_type:complete